MAKRGGRKGKGAKGKSKGKKRGAKGKRGKKVSKRSRKLEPVKVRAVKTDDPWGLQNGLRKKKYFARAVGPNKVATNAPASLI